MSIFTWLRGVTSNSPKSFPAKLVTEEISPFSPVMALRVGDLIDGPLMQDLVVRVEHTAGGVLVTTNSGRTEYATGDTVRALRRVRSLRTGDWHLVPVR